MKTMRLISFAALGLAFSFSANAETTKEYEGKGYYFNTNGDSGPYEVTSIVKKAEEGFSIETTFSWDGGSETSAWTGTPFNDNYYTVSIDGEEAGLGVCYKPGANKSLSFDLGQFDLVDAAEQLLGKVLKKACLTRTTINGAYTEVKTFKFAGGFMARSGSEINVEGNTSKWREVLRLKSESIDEQGEAPVREEAPVAEDGTEG